MTKEAAMVVAYNFDESGYVVLTIDKGTILDEYRAGNNQHSSMTFASSDYEAVPVTTLKVWARNTANEIADELRQRGNRVSVVLDTDINADDYEV